MGKPAAPAKTIKATVPVIERDDVVKPDEPPAENKDLHDVVAGPANSKGDSTATGINEMSGKGKGTGLTEHAETKSNIPLVIVEQMPEFAGDMDSYINSHTQYPEQARSANIDGKVIVRFVVNEDGSVSNVEVVRGIGGGCDQEALRMVRSMPRWKPGKQNGIAVKVYFTLPIKFQLN